MKESKRRRSLSGAVLIMILTVMFVLIILLTATLTTVTTANQRIYTKYEENQAYYTARSALDVFTQNMLSDSNYWAGKTYDYTNKTAADDIGANQTGKQMKQGLALQFDLYKIQSQCETYGKTPTDPNKKYANFKFAENMTEAEANSIFCDANMGYTLSTYAEAKNFSIETTTPLNGDSDTSKQYDYIEYQVTLPTLSDGSNEYGKFVDVDYSKADKPQFAKIKVEVLDRIYATEPSYTADQLKRYFTGDANQTGCPANDTDLMAAIAKGSRSKDYMRIKITSTVRLLDTEGVAVVIVDTTKKDPPSTDRALTTTGATIGGSGNGVNAGGGSSTMNLGTTAAGDGNIMSGSLFTLGSFQFVSSAQIKLNKTDSLVAMDGIKWGAIVKEDGNPASSNAIHVGTVEEGAYVLLGGNSEISSGGQKAYVGIDANNLNGSNPGKKMPLLGDVIKAEGLYLNGDLYADTLEYTQGNPGQWTVTGNIYARKIVLPNSYKNFLGLDGGIPTQCDLSSVFGKTVQLCKEYEVCWIDESGNLMDITDVATGYSACGKPAFDSTSPNSIVSKDGVPYKKYDLPFAVDGKNYIEVPTPQVYFGEYFPDGAFDSKGELTLADGSSSTDYSQIYSTANINAKLKSGANLFDDYYSSQDNTYIKLGSITDFINNKSIPQLPAGGAEITLDGSDKIYYLSGGYAGQLKVTGSTGRLILLIPEDDTSVSFNNFTIVTDELSITNGLPVTNGTTKAPKIDIYGGTDSKITTSNECFIAGYVMMPTGDIDWNKGAIGQVHYDDGKGNSMVASDYTAFIGSVLCRTFKEQNKIGVFYLDKNSGDETPGEPHLTVQSSQYVRS